MRKRQLSSTNMNLHFLISKSSKWQRLTHGLGLNFEREKRQRKLAKALPQVCFTVFTLSKLEELSSVASKAGFEVKSSVTKSLRILVCGSNAGPSKIRKAEALNCLITDEIGFEGGRVK